MTTKLSTKSGQGGFTLMEALIATALTTVVMTLIFGAVMTVRDSYMTDVVRARINSNLRSAMDIISMNIRQAGEYLQSSFPAVVVTNGVDDAPDELILRRSTLPETMTLCADASAEDTTITVSTTSLANAACLTANVASTYNVFANLRLDNEDEILRVYIYDRMAKVGEFIDFTNNSLSGGQYFLTVSALENDYDAMNTSLYIIEELNFYLDTDNNTLMVNFDGYTDEPRAVAFEVTGFQLSIDMSDDTTVAELNEASALDWKDIEQISVTLDGQDSMRNIVLNSSVTAAYFPRNVLSYD